MKKLLDIANRYVEESDWKTIAALKFCLLSLGLLAGMSIPRRRRKPVRLFAAAAFTLTYFPLMAKLFRVMDEMRESTEEARETEPERKPGETAEGEAAEGKEPEGETETEEAVPEGGV